MPDFQLHIGGWKYSGWTSLQVTRSIEQLAHSYQFDLTDRWLENEDQIPVEGGDSCQISYEDDWVTSGWIDEPFDQYDANRDTMSFTGRSSTADLVDCAAIYRGGQWRNQGLLKIASDICSPFDIEVSSNVDLGETFPTFDLEDGETAFAAISRAAREVGVLPLTKADGNLIFDRVGSTKIDTKLERGKNILSGTKRESWQNRFSTYILKAQARGNDNFFGSAAASIKRSSNDDGVTRYRPMIISGIEESNGRRLQQRANWERNVRAGKALRVSYKVQGWEHEGGLWEPNTIVPVKDPRFRLDDTELLIVQATHTRSEQEGSITILTLTFPEAFDIEPLPTRKNGTLS